MENLSFNQHIEQAEEAIEYSPQLALAHMIKAIKHLSRVIVMQHDAMKEQQTAKSGTRTSPVKPKARTKN